MNCLMAAALVLLGAGRTCPCAPGTNDLATELKSALAFSPHVYRAKVLSVSHRLPTTVLNVVRSAKGLPAADEDLATLEVLEVFKGGLRVGRHLEVKNGDGTDCAVLFSSGNEVLVYSLDQDPTSVVVCSRTRAIVPTDIELAWLRTGVLPRCPWRKASRRFRCSSADPRTSSLGSSVAS